MFENIRLASGAVDETYVVLELPEQGLKYTVSFCSSTDYNGALRVAIFSRVFAVPCSTMRGLSVPPMGSTRYNIVADCMHYPAPRRPAKPYK